MLFLLLGLIMGGVIGFGWRCTCRSIPGNPYPFLRDYSEVWANFSQFLAVHTMNTILDVQEFLVKKQPIK